MKYLLYIGISLAICFSCSQGSKEDIYILRDEHEIVLPPKEIAFDNLFCLEQVRLKDSLLLLIDRCDSCFFHLYNMNQHQLVYSFGAKGQGPNDFLYPAFLIEKENRDSLFCYDTNQHLMKSIAWTSIESGEVTDIKSTAIAASICGAPVLIKTGGHYWGTMDYLHNGPFFIYSEKRDSIIWFDYPQSILKHSDELGLQARICVNQSTNAVAVGMRYYNKLFLYSNEGKLKREVCIGSDNIFPTINKKKNIVMDNSVLCSQWLHATDNHVYLLQSGWQEQDATNEKHASRILVFDWDLNYIVTYQLPHKVIYFTIDETSSTLAYTGLKGEQCIVGIISLKEQ